MMPSPFGPPPAPPGGMGGMMQRPQPSAVDVVTAMRQLVGTPIKAPEPIYRPGYKKPKAPDVEWITGTGKRLHGSNQKWREYVHTILLWTRQELSGAFKEDVQARIRGLQDEFPSSALSDERNLIISKGAALKPSFRKRATSDEDKGYAQRLEDAAIWLRANEQRMHANGNRPLELDEWALLTDYGMLVTRDTLDKDNTKCPVFMRLIDPAQVNPVWGARGLDHVFRVYRDTTDRICATYGDFNPTQLKKLKDQIGEIGDQTEHEVIEYWGTWHRAVLIGDTEIMPVTEHKYGEVPFTVQYGGFGEPMLTRTPAYSRAGSAQSWSRDSLMGLDRINKAVPYLFYRIASEEFYQSMMARLVDAYKSGLNPATVRYRSDMAAEHPMPELDGTAGAQNEAMLGEEKIEALPLANLPLADRLLSAVMEDRARGSAPAEMYGRLEKSNITGVAQAGANDAGQHLLFPTVKAWEMGLSLRYERIFRLLGNFGHLSTNGPGGGRSIMVPSTRKNTKPAYPFDREVIDRVGPEIEVSFTKVDPRDWAPLFAAGATGVERGFITRADIRGIATGDFDFDRFTEEWTEENALFGAQQLPDFQKLNVMASLVEEIKENEGRPEIQDHYRRMAQIWEKVIAPPQQPPMGGDPSMGGQPQQGMPQSPSPPPPGSTVIPPQGQSPGVPGQMSYPQMGQGPGSGGAPVGRPY